MEGGKFRTYQHFRENYAEKIKSQKMNMYGIVGDLYIRNIDILASRQQQHSDSESVGRLEALIGAVQRAKGAVARSSQQNI